MEEEECAYFGEVDGNFQPMLSNAWLLGVRNFRVEFPALISELLRAARVLPPSDDVPPKILKLELSNAGIASREALRDEVIPVWPIVRASYTSVCVLLDALFADRPIERFWVLETVARLPYLAYSTCLHFFGTLGWYRSNALMTLHRSEDLNENFHLSIMEALGGDQRWADRFIAFHASLVYFWILVILFFVSPKQSYGFSLLLETHAVDTYEQFIEENKHRLELLPVPKVAYTYFDDYLFYFQEIQISSSPQRQRPQLNSLYDVFMNILEDEKEHSAAMEACAMYVDKGVPVVFNGKKVVARARNLKMKERRQRFWKDWNKSNNGKGNGNGNGIGVKGDDV